jgi:hypothetical protein
MHEPMEKHPIALISNKGRKGVLMLPDASQLPQLSYHKNKNNLSSRLQPRQRKYLDHSCGIDPIPKRLKEEVAPGSGVQVIFCLNFVCLAVKPFLLLMEALRVEQRGRITSTTQIKLWGM